MPARPHLPPPARIAGCRVAGCLMAGCLIAGGLTSFGAASHAARPPLDLVPVEEGVGDIDPLAANLRVLPRDLRLPMGFERVYRVPGRDDLYMRVAGGLVAVFPRSEYIPGPGGLWPIIPPGTRFYPGGLPPELSGEPPPSAAGGTEGPERVSSRTEGLAQPLVGIGELEAARAEALARARTDERDGRSIWTDEAFRAGRIGSIIEAAGSLQE